MNAKTGFVKPRIDYLPNSESDSELADAALRWLPKVGFYLDPWQEHLVRNSMLTRPEGTWLCREYGYLVARQNGKGGILTARSLIDLFFLKTLDEYGRSRPRLVVYTAHQFKTSNEAFERLKSVIEDSPKLRRLMQQDRNMGVRNSAQDKGFDLANGNRMRYLARSRGGSGRGWTIDTLLTDEAQELPDAAWDALKFTQRALPNPQRIVTGTVPRPEDNDAIWTGIRDTGRAGTSRASGWAEWSPDPDDKITRHDMTRPARVGRDIDPQYRYALATNPAFGIRITPETIEDDADGGVTAYRREVLCWWPNADSSEKLLMPNWAKLHHAESQIQGRLCFGVEVAEDRSWAAIVVAGQTLDPEIAHIEVIDYRAGTDWLIDRLVELQAVWSPQATVVDFGGPAGSIVAEMVRSGVALFGPDVRQLGQACGLWYDQVSASKVHWLNHKALTLAVNAAKFRTLGNAQGWDRRVNVDISPLNAGSLALWALFNGVEGEVPERVNAGVSNRVYGFR